MHPRASSARFQFIEYVIHILHSEKIGKERGRDRAREIASCRGFFGRQDCGSNMRCHREGTLEHTLAHTYVRVYQKTNIYIYICICVCVYITIFQSGSSINKAQARKQFIKSSLETRPLRGIELIKAAAKSQ